MDEHDTPDSSQSFSTHWMISKEQLSNEIGSFVIEFGSFTPEWFAEVKFHLLRESGLNKESRDQFCDVAISAGHCPRCDLLYSAKKCPLWYRLYKIAEWKLVERAPPCIRLAFIKRNIKTVVDYLVAVNLIDPPFYRSRRRAPSCKMMRRWGLCKPNEFCNAMTTDNTAEYISARERVKLSRPLPQDDID